MDSAPRRYCIVVCFEDERRERFLMVRNLGRGWELPGGRIENEESPDSAALREFAEETGHRVRNLRLVLTQERANGTAWVFVGEFGEATTSAPKAGEPIVERRFVRKLHDVTPLAFPGDPYEVIEQALGRPLR